jgi:hypothetical protein
MDISAEDYPHSLYSVEPIFGTSYDMEQAADQAALQAAVQAADQAAIQMNKTEIKTPPPISWKQRLALKACFLLLISLPFIMVAIIQPWNDKPAH